MNEREVRRCVALWQERLNLGAWRIEVDFATPVAEESSVMQVDRTRDYLTARIRLASNWRDWTTAAAWSAGEPELTATPRTLDEIVAHELLHIVLHDLSTVPDLIDGYLHRDVAELLERVHDHRLERAVEELARVLAAAYR